MNKAVELFKKAPFPAVLTLLCVPLSCAAYLLVTAGAVEPFYVSGLVFFVPVLCFGLVTALTARGLLKKAVSVAVTAILIPALAVGAFCTVFWFSVSAATTTTTDPAKYGRALRLSGYPDSELVAFFPDEIPSGAEGTVFVYHPGFLQGGRVLGLKFDAGADMLGHFLTVFRDGAQWTGRAGNADAEANGILPGLFGELGYASLPDDFTVYRMAGGPYQPGNWNHGRLGVAAISLRRNELLFYAEEW